MVEDHELRLEDDEVLIERARYTRALSAQLKKLHDEAKQQGQVVPLDISENLQELQLEPVKSRQKLPRMIVHKIYPPSKANFETLSNISLAKLTPHTPHDGKSLLVYTVSDPVRVGRKNAANVDKASAACAYISVNIADKIQSGERATAVLELYNCFHRLPIDECLPKGSTLRIREPFYTLTTSANSEALVVRVDHPTDLEVIYPFASEQPSSHWKQLGDAAYRLHRYQEAAAWLTKGLEVVELELQACIREGGQSTEKLNRAKISLLLNRAATRLEQARFDECIEDCNRVLGFEYNFKAIYRRAKAYFGLGSDISLDRPELAALVQHCQIHPEDKSPVVKDFLGVVEETSAAKYNWSALQSWADSSLILPAQRWEHSGLMVTYLPNRGRGVVARRLIRAGTLIVVSPASVLRYADAPSSIDTIRIDTVKSRCDVGHTNDISAELTNELYHNRSKKKQIYNLYAGPEYSRDVVEEDHTVDAFRMHGVQLHNSFEMDGSEIFLTCLPVLTSAAKQRVGTGIWYYPSFFNHSCLPNCSRIFLSNLLLIKTTREIQPSDELTMGYINKLHDYNDRKDCFYDFGFVCKCELCKLEESQFREHAKEYDIREDALLAYKNFATESMNRNNTSTDDLKSSVTIVQGIIERLRDSYERSGVKTMRYGLLRPLNALCALHMSLRNLPDALVAAKALLELSPPNHGMDDLTLQARTLVAGLQIKISFAAGQITSQTLEINHSLAKVVEAWNIRGLVPGFAGYWHELGPWWQDFLDCSKVREDATRQRILRAFLEASR